MKFLQWNVSWLDAADIIVVWVFLYYFLLLVRGTRAVQILQGVVVLLIFQALFYFLKLQTIYFVLRALVLSIVVALPIVFQPELRRALMQLGARSLLAPFTHVSRDVLMKIIDEISWAASLLSQMRTGALIVIERETGLEEFIETGVQVNGVVSSKLLLSIFIPRSPLHDGAAILRGDKVVAAACYLPLSESPPTSKHRMYGTRHRAALGLAEQTDAIVVVVSEETGSISLAKDGKLYTELPEETLKKVLLAFCAPPTGRATTPQVVRGARATLREMVTRWLTRPAPAPAAEVPPQASVTTRLPLDTPDDVPSLVEEVPLEPPAVSEPQSAVERSEEEISAEQQRLTEEAVQKRAEEARRRKAEEEARKADEETRGDGRDDSAPARPTEHEKPLGERA